MPVVSPKENQKCAQSRDGAGCNSEIPTMLRLRAETLINCSAQQILSGFEVNKFYIRFMSFDMSCSEANKSKRFPLPAAEKRKKIKSQCLFDFFLEFHSNEQKLIFSELQTRNLISQQRALA